MKGFEQLELGMNPHLLDLVKDFMRGITGHGFNNPVKSKAIEQALGIKGSQVRAMARYLRRSKIPVGSYGKGYFYAETKDEWDIFLAHMKQRRDSLNKTIKECERVDFNQPELFKKGTT